MGGANCHEPTFSRNRQRLLFTGFWAFFRRFSGSSLFFCLSLALAQIGAQRLGFARLAGLIGTGRTLSVGTARGVIVCTVLNTVWTGHL